MGCGAQVSFLLFFSTRFSCFRKRSEDRSNCRIAGFVMGFLGGEKSSFSLLTFFAVFAVPGRTGGSERGGGNLENVHGRTGVVGFFPSFFPVLEFSKVGARCGTKGRRVSFLLLLLSTEGQEDLGESKRASRDRRGSWGRA